MFLRALAVLAAVAVPLLLSIAAISTLHPAMFWIGPLLAIVSTLPILHAATRARGQVLVGAALAAMAAASTPELPELLAISSDDGDALAVHDLREAPLPDWADGYVAVRGHLATQWVVDEYRVETGERPDQNEEPEAVLLPLLGTEDEAVAVGGTFGRVVVARVHRSELDGPKLVTLRGRLAPVGREIVESLFIVRAQGQVDQLDQLDQLDAVMLDTLDMPTRGQALTRTGLAVGAALLSLILLLTALPRAGREPDASDRDDRG